MSLGLGFVNLAANLSIDIETIILLLVMAGCLVFYAKGFTFGIVMSFLGSGLSFMLIYGLHTTFDTNINYAPSLVVFFMCLVVMAITLYSAKQSQTGDLI